MANAVAIYIDSREKSIHYYSNADGSLVHDSRGYSSGNFDADFYKTFGEIVQDFFSKHSPAQAMNATIILPDHFVLTDTINMPTMKGKAQINTLESTLNGMFVKRADLRIRQYCAFSNKQFSSFCIAGVREDLLENFKAAAATHHVAVQNFTYASAASAAAVGMLNSKLRNGTYLFFDLKEKCTRVFYVFRGETIGFTMLPFGYSILSRNKVEAEDMLFDHATAELAVLNARERAKAKALTVMDSSAVDVNEVEGENSNADGEEQSTIVGDAEEEKKEKDADEDDDEKSFTVNENVPTHVENLIKVLPKKTARKLPKFMQRPTPEGEEGYVAENFRIFEKWALGYLQANNRLTSMGKTDAVYFNMPSEYSFVLDIANKEEKENGIRFLPASLDSKDESVLRNLELYGGLHILKSKGHNVF